MKKKRRRCCCLLKQDWEGLWDLSVRLVGFVVSLVRFGALFGLALLHASFGADLHDIIPRHVL